MFDDNESVDATNQNPSFVYSNAGIYTVSLRVTNAVGADTQTLVDYITVSAVNQELEMVFAALAEGGQFSFSTTNVVASRDQTLVPRRVRPYPAGHVPSHREGPMPAPVIELTGRTHVCFEGQELLYFAGGDYHGFSRDPTLWKIAADTVRRYGLGPSASRSTTGNHPLYLQLEERVAGFFGTEAAAVVSTGYLGNAILLGALADDFELLLADEKAHVSLLDAARQAGKPLLRYRHFDADHLAGVLRREGQGRRPLILTDSVDGMMGDVAPLPDLLAVSMRDGGGVLLDEAHAFGVLGDSGRGSLEAWEVSAERVHRTGSFGKAFGAFGGLIPGSEDLIVAVRGQPAFRGATPIPLPLLAVADAVLERLARDPGAILDLKRRALAFKAALRETGCEIEVNQVPIISLAVNGEEQARRSRAVLLAHGIYPSHVHYPGLPPGGMFRFILRSSNTDEETARLLAALIETAS